MRRVAHLLGVDHRRAHPVNEISKTQAIRLADVFFIGPVMIVGGRRLARRGDQLIGDTLALLGIATIFYNGYNYVKNRR